MLSSLVVLLTFLCISGAKLDTFLKNYSFPQTTYVSYGTVRDMNKLIYTRFSASQPNTTNRCIVTMISGAFDGIPGLSSECEIPLKPEMPNGQIIHSCEAYEFGSDKVIILWGEEQLDIDDIEKETISVIVKTSVIDMMKNCHTVEATKRKYEVQKKLYAQDNSVSIDCFHPRVIIFDDSYELLLVDKTNILCKSELTHCDYVLYKFDSKVYKLTGPEQWPNSFSNNSCSIWYDVESAKLSQGTQGYYISDIRKIELANKNSKEKLQIWSDPSKKSREGYIYSFANDAIGLCQALGNSTFNCLQFDQKGKIITKTEFRIDNPFGPTLSDVYSLRNGGLLVLIWTNSTQEYFIQINKYGIIKAVEISYFDLPEDSYLLDSRIFENNLGQYCMAKMLTKYREATWTPINTTMHCTSPDYFFKCVNNIC